MAFGTPKHPGRVRGVRSFVFITQYLHASKGFGQKAIEAKIEAQRKMFKVQKQMYEEELAK